MRCHTSRLQHTPMPRATCHSLLGHNLRTPTHSPPDTPCGVVPCKLSHSDPQPDPRWGSHGCVAAHSSVRVHKQAPPDHTGQVVMVPVCHTTPSSRDTLTGAQRYHALPHHPDCSTCPPQGPHVTACWDITPGPAHTHRHPVRCGAVQATAIHSPTQDGDHTAVSLPTAQSESTNRHHHTWSRRTTPRPHRSGVHDARVIRRHRHVTH